MRKLYVLPFDHRGSFIEMLGFSAGNLTKGDIAKLKDYKHVVYEGFLAALKLGVHKEDGAILIDEQFGAEIHEEAREAGITRILTVEKSGQDEFDFEYGESFGEHIKKLTPDYVKALVRYNYEGDKEMNMRQIGRLKVLNDFCINSGYKFLFELLAVPTKEQLKNAGGVQGYEKVFQARIMQESICELKAGGVDPDIWKVEGLENENDMRGVVEEALRPSSQPPPSFRRRQGFGGQVGGQAEHAGSEKERGVIVLGRGESEEKVEKWLSVAAKIPGVIGMAVGRTVFRQPLLDYAAGKISREDAIQKIAGNYKRFVNIFESAQA